LTRLFYVNDPLNLRPPVLGRAGHDPQVLGHQDFAAAVGVTAEDEDLAPRVDEVLGDESLSEFLCQPSRVRYLLVIPVTRSSNKMAKWFSASFQ